ncbi:unnamed protein product [Trichogramma brassicae]|uniref:Uncharacterized protein n=1 Tax=Trichogramma brassicae TaxID=86971 RepID=A0A6H5I6X1_9HYME|nr:unnamed protein product [Trichogramma brassicae]
MEYHCFGSIQLIILMEYLWYVSNNLPTYDNIITATYADDTAILSAHPCPDTASLRLQEHLHRLEEWYKAMTAHPRISHNYLLARRRASLCIFTLTVYSRESVTAINATPKIRKEKLNLLPVSGMHRDPCWARTTRHLATAVSRCISPALHRTRDLCAPRTAQGEDEEASRRCGALVRISSHLLHDRKLASPRSTTLRCAILLRWRLLLLGLTLPRRGRRPLRCCRRRSSLFDRGHGPSLRMVACGPSRLVLALAPALVATAAHAPGDCVRQITAAQHQTRTSATSLAIYSIAAAASAVAAEVLVEAAEAIYGSVAWASLPKKTPWRISRLSFFIGAWH